MTKIPLTLSWHEADNPLPTREVRTPVGMSRSGLGVEAPPWHTTGPTDKPFDFCSHIRRLCEDVVEHCTELAHIDVSRLLFGMTQARNGNAHGLQARVTPLRFGKGRLEQKLRGVNYRVQRYYIDGNEMLYLVTFCLPRFLEQSFDDKFVTLFHELFHISPAFDGDLRRYKGRQTLHAPSKRAYDAYMVDLARGYLRNGADHSRHHFLRLNFAQLRHRHGSVRAAVVPRPRLVPVEEPDDHAEVVALGEVSHPQVVVGS